MSSPGEAPPRGGSAAAGGFPRQPFLAAVVLAAALAPYGVEGNACASLDNTAFVYKGVVNSAVLVELAALGVGKQVEVTCVDLVEKPENKSGCGTRSELQICRSKVDERLSCQSLAQFIYSTHGSAEFGSASGEDYNWLLAYDGRGKSQECYPRSLDIGMLVSVSSPEEGESSLALSIIAVIVVILIVLCIGLVLAIYFHRKTQQNRATHVPEHQMTVEDGDGPPVTQAPLPVVTGAPLTGGGYAGDGSGGYELHPHQHGKAYPHNPIDRTFDEKAGYDPHYGQHYPQHYPQQPLHGSPSGMYAVQGQPHYPPHPQDMEPAPLVDPTSMALACADCGQQIGHPGTLAACPMTGKIHPPKVVS